MYNDNPVDEGRAEWIGAAEALALVEAHNGFGQAAVSICTRAYVGLVPSRARLLIMGMPTGRSRGSESLENGYLSIPREFWWAEGHEALDANWASGDFSTIMNDTHEWKAFGVEFDRKAIESMLAPRASGDEVSPPSSPAAESDMRAPDFDAPTIVGKRRKGGRTLMHDHPYVAGRVALELNNLDEKERDNHTHASVAAQMEKHYRLRHKSGGAPDAHSIDDHAKSLLDALKDHWKTNKRG